MGKENNHSGLILKKDSTKEILIATLQYLKPHKIKFLISIICLVSCTILGTIQPLLFGKIIDFITQKQYNLLINSILIISGIFILNMILGYIQNCLMIFIASRIEMSVCRQMFTSMMYLTMDKYSNTRRGEFITKLEHDVQTFSSILTQKILIFIDAASALFVGIILFRLSWQLTLMLILLFPVSLVIFSTFGKKIRVKELFLKERKDIYFSFLYEALNGFKTIKIFSAENLMAEKYSNILKRIYSIGIDKFKINTVANTLSQSVNFLGYILILIVGIYLIFKGKLTLGGLVAFNSYSSAFTNSLFKISQINSKIQEAVISLKRVFDLINQYSLKKESKTFYPDVPEHIFKENVRLENVTFNYNKSENNLVLNKINLTIYPNRITAIVGESGSGKTTLLNIIMGLYDNYGGSITVGNISYGQIPKEMIFNKIAYVTQEFFLITGTITDNLLLANMEANEKEIIEACKAANIHDFIWSLPNKYNTKIGSDGIDLSTGQKQKLSIARALLKKAEIYLFDEITSSLDVDSENEIKKLVKSIAKNHMVVIVSHKLSSITDAEKVILMNKGRILYETEDVNSVINNYSYEKIEA